MSQMPIPALSPEEQQRLMNGMYVLLGKQVKSYHKHRHMGENSSIPLELAQELTESIAYTLQLTGGLLPGQALEEALHSGQTLLEARVQQAKELLRLVIATAPQWQSECRWDALRCIEEYLTGYDHLHLAHRGPEELFYPILTAVPEDAQGIDVCLYHLNILWLENQIMAGVPETAAEALWNELPQNLCFSALNQCEQLLINGIGKAIAAPNLGGLLLTDAERAAVSAALREKTAEKIREALDRAAVRLCAWLHLTDPNAIAYAKRIVPPLHPRLTAALPTGDLSGIFL